MNPDAGLPDVGLLPHRAPFLFVDEVVAYDPGQSITATYRVTGDEQLLAGHFPGRPVFPGVLQLEALAQTGALALLADPTWADTLPLFGGVERARFRRLVGPGDTLELEVGLERMSRRGGWGQGRARVDGNLAAEARLLFVIERRR